jgi:hypothetical protein
VDGIVLEVRELTVAGIPVQAASVRLDLINDQQTRLTVSAQSATLAGPVGRLSDLRLVCEDPVIAEPRFACDSGKLQGRGGPAGNVDMKVAAFYDTGTGTLGFNGEGWKVAGTQARFKATANATGTQVLWDTGTTAVSALRAFVKPWIELPADITGDGKAKLRGSRGSHQ